ncbi:MAG: hypothetical protein BRC33_10945 [Cyanobacteria bacterium SW_9_44_58]|nr:MAG: hypothetical protein BRC33_10945 [Cyanobacteria bacterium SW_9_44_58]
MLPKLFAGIAIAIALFTVGASYTQRSALSLREESKSQYYWPRHNTGISGVYVGGSWQPAPFRSDYGGGFRGGGPGSGK